MKIAVFSLVAALGLASAAQAEIAYGLTGSLAGSSLIRFDTATPGGAVSVGALTGVTSGFSIRAIDFRPSTGELFSIGVDSTKNGRLFRVNTTTGAFTAIGSSFAFASNADSRVSMDFDPTTDQIRVITGNRQNVRINPSTGALIAQDTNLTAGVFQGDVAYAASGAAYLYDYSNDNMNTFAGNSGVASVLLASPVILAWDSGIGFDISPASGNAFLSYQATDAVFSSPLAETLASVNLTTGVVTNIGAFTGFNVLDIAVVPAPGTLGLLGLAGLAAARRRRA